ncbi:MAG: hypothetical protein ACK58L_02815 [Planctomycetota bacterium]
MADVLGDALQKLAVTRALTPPESNSDMSLVHATNTPERRPADLSIVLDGALIPEVTDLENSSLPVGTTTCSAYESLAVSDEPCPPDTKRSLDTPSPMSHKNSETKSFAAEPVGGRSEEAESEAAEFVTNTPSSSQTSRWAKMSRLVSERRRQLAAVVVIICMVGLWFDESGSSEPALSQADTLSEDFADVEAALSEFDVKSAPPMREPAEPVDAAGTPELDLTIPGDHVFSESVSGTQNAAKTIATSPNASGRTEIPATTNPIHQPESAGFSAAPVSVPSGKGRSVRARLSRSIQPVH